MNAKAVQTLTHSAAPHGINVVLRYVVPVLLEEAKALIRDVVSEVFNDERTP